MAGVWRRAGREQTFRFCRSRGLAGRAAGLEVRSLDVWRTVSREQVGILQVCNWEAAWCDLLALLELITPAAAHGDALSANLQMQAAGQSRYARRLR